MILSKKEAEAHFKEHGLNADDIELYTYVDKFKMVPVWTSIKKGFYLCAFRGDTLPSNKDKIFVSHDQSCIITEYGYYKVMAEEDDIKLVRIRYILNEQDAISIATKIGFQNLASVALCKAWVNDRCFIPAWEFSTAQNDSFFILAISIEVEEDATPPVLVPLFYQEKLVINNLAFLPNKGKDGLYYEVKLDLPIHLLN